MGFLKGRRVGDPREGKGVAEPLAGAASIPAPMGPAWWLATLGSPPDRGALAGLLRDLAGWLQNQGQGPGSSPAPSICCLLSSRLLSRPSPWSPPCPRLALLWLLPSWPLCPCLPRLPGWVEPADDWSGLWGAGRGLPWSLWGWPWLPGGPCPRTLSLPPSQLRGPLALVPQTLALPQAQSSCLCRKIPGAEIRLSRLPVRPSGLWQPLLGAEEARRAGSRGTHERGWIPAGGVQSGIRVQEPDSCRSEWQPPALWGDSSSTLKMTV